MIMKCAEDLVLESELLLKMTAVSLSQPIVGPEVSAIS